MDVDDDLADALGVEGATGGETPAVVLVVDHDAGVRRFEAGVTAPGGRTVERVAAGDLGVTFDVTAGGPGAESVEARAVDFVGAGRQSPVVLFGVRFDAPVDPGTVGFTARQLIDHEETDVDGSAVRVDPAERTEPL
jgi:hypothetical protein